MISHALHSGEEDVMRWYTLVVFVHIAAAVALLAGSVIGSPAVRAAVRRAATTRELRAYLGVGGPLLVLEPAGALLVLASGIYLTAFWGWSLGWIQVATGLWIVNLVVAAALVHPAHKRIAQAAAGAGDEPVGPQLHALRSSPRWLIGGDVLMANDAAVLYLMVAKPGLAISLATAAGLNALVLAVRLVMGRLQRSATSVAAASPG
jgi:hypothetical protein